MDIHQWHYGTMIHRLYEDQSVDLYTGDYIVDGVRTFKNCKQRQVDELVGFTYGTLITYAISEAGGLPRVFKPVHPTEVKSKEDHLSVYLTEEDVLPLLFDNINTNRPNRLLDLRVLTANLEIWDYGISHLQLNLPD